MNRREFNDLVSKTSSMILRHKANEFSLTLDPEGWVDIEEFISKLRVISSTFHNISRTDLDEMIQLSEKKRHQICGDKIRALYGHSAKQSVYKNPVEIRKIPKILFHGSPKANVKSIREKGLLAVSRQYVHLSESAQQAQSVALRYSKEINLIEVLAKEYAKNGGLFHFEGDVWLTKQVPPEYLHLCP